MVAVWVVVVKEKRGMGLSCHDRVFKRASVLRVVGRCFVGWLASRSEPLTVCIAGFAVLHCDIMSSAQQDSVNMRRNHWKTVAMAVAERSHDMFFTIASRISKSVPKG